MNAGRAGELAHRLDTAWRERVPIEPFGTAGEIADPAQALAVQRAWSRLRADRGERTLGRKIGLTSEGMRRQMGVSEPDYGDLWASRHFAADAGVATIPTAPFIQPRVEGEVAFLLARDLCGAAISEPDVRAATAGVAPALEIVDSRIIGWRITLVDTIADNASYGAFTHGPWSTEPLAGDLADLTMQVFRNREVVVDETGAAVMGSPLTAVAWLANAMNAFGTPLRAGDIVLSGSFGPAVDLAPGDEFSLVIAGRPALTAHFH